MRVLTSDFGPITNARSMETLLGTLPNGDDDDLLVIKREAGTFETCRLYGAMSAFGGNSEDICSHRVLLGLTQSRRRPGLKVVQLRLSIQAATVAAASSMTAATSPGCESSDMWLDGTLLTGRWSRRRF